MAAHANSRFALVVKTGDAASPSSTILNFAGEPSINLDGSIGFVASISGLPGTGQAVLKADRPTPFSIFQPASTYTTPSISSFLSVASNREFAFQQINNAGNIVARDRVAGSPPSFRVRTWYGLGTFLTAAQSGGTFLSVTTPTISNLGDVAFVGVHDAGSRLYFSEPGLLGYSSPEEIAQLSGGGFRPQMADNRSVVVRSGSGTTSSVQLFSKVGGSWWTQVVSEPGEVVGAAPGISDNGRYIAYLGGSESARVLASFDTETTTRRTLVNQGATVFGPLGKNTTVSFSSPDTRVATESLNKFFGEQQMCAFIADARINGVNKAALFVARHATSENKLANLTPIVTVGDKIRDITDVERTVKAVAIHDPLTRNGDVAFRIDYDDGGVTKQAIYTYRAASFTKFKQGSSGPTFFENGVATTPWFDKTIPKGKLTYTSGGCWITAFATASSYFGLELSPLQMGQGLDSRGLLPSGNISLNLAGDPKANFIFAGSGSRYAEATKTGGTLTDISNELRAGRPLILGVPSSHHYLNGSDVMPHAIFAYGIDPRLGASETVQAKHILISDPRNSSSVASLARYTDYYARGEEVIDDTLQSYFDRVNAERSNALGEFTPELWFDLDQYQKNGNSITRNGNYARYDVIFLGTRESPIPPLLTTVPAVSVESPVDLVIVGPDGKRYVTSPSLATAGDILLEKSFSSPMAIMDDENGVLPPLTEVAFPPYMVFLPDSLIGANLDVDVVGIGDGSFRVTLLTGSQSFSAPASLIGTITTGQVLKHSFVVTAVPEPGEYLLMLFGLLVIWAKIGRRRHAVLDRRR